MGDEEREYAVSFASRSCNLAHKNNSSYDGECLVVVWGVINFREYLFGQTFRPLCRPSSTQMADEDNKVGKKACTVGTDTTIA